MGVRGRGRGRRASARHLTGAVWQEEAVRFRIQGLERQGDWKHGPSPHLVGKAISQTAEVLLASTAFTRCFGAAFTTFQSDPPPPDQSLRPASRGRCPTLTYLFILYRQRFQVVEFPKRFAQRFGNA